MLVFTIYHDQVELYLGLQLPVLFEVYTHLLCLSFSVFPLLFTCSYYIFTVLLSICLSVLSIIFTLSVQTYLLSVSSLLVTVNTYLLSVFPLLFTVITYLLSVCLSLFSLYCCHSYFPLLSRCLWHGRNTAFWPKKKSNIYAIPTVIQKHQFLLLPGKYYHIIPNQHMSAQILAKMGGYLGKMVLLNAPLTSKINNFLKAFSALYGILIQETAATLDNYSYNFCYYHHNLNEILGIWFRVSGPCKFTTSLVY